MLKFMKHSLVSAGIKLSLLTLASRILGLVREMTKAAFLGVIEDSLIILIKSITEAKTLLSAFIDKIPKEF